VLSTRPNATHGHNEQVPLEARPSALDRDSVGEKTADRTVPCRANNPLLSVLHGPSASLSLCVERTAEHCRDAQALS